ncbi:unnamed protein product, partial [Discosporangium mesarthrocarpum]
SSGALKALQDTVISCNALAMAALGRGNAVKCRSLLARAMGLATGARQPCSGLVVLTLNNTACLFRRIGEPRQALRYLRRAVEVGEDTGSYEHLAVTHLNACTVLSQLGR